MTAVRKHTARCHHKASSQDCGIALIGLGNSLRGDDAIASELLKLVPSSMQKDVCVFDLGIHTTYISECIAGHSAAIIIDCTENGTQAGTIVISNIVPAIKGNRSVLIESPHGISIMDELRLFAKQETLPAQIIFFGIEGIEFSAGDQLSEQVQKVLPNAAKILLDLIQSIKRMDQKPTARKAG